MGSKPSKKTEPKTYRFPDGFLFGAASSACQIESGVHEGGKGEDVGDHYSRLYPEKYCNADPDRSAGFYYRYPEDVALMKELGLKAFRFSISWSRIYPVGPERVSAEGIRDYSDLIDRLKAAGIVTFFDLFHCDLPYWVIEMGGIADRRFIEWFSVYAKTCFEAFGSRVDYWSTVNEPSINVFGAYAKAHNAPFLSDPDLAIKADHNMLLAHYRAVRLYHEGGYPGKISAVIHFVPTYALTDDAADWEAAKRKQAYYSGIWLDPMFLGRYPEILMDEPYFTGKLPENAAEELREAFEPSDYIGINYYSPDFAKFEECDRLDYKTVENPALPKDSYGFTRYPKGLTDSVTYLAKTYPGKEIFITENGIGMKKSGDPAKDLEDDYRISYLNDHLKAASEAIEVGAPLAGYFHWSIMDTNELYGGGYSFNFGLVQIDYETLRRTPRKSWYYYRDIIRKGEVEE